jgi:AcrR family transcriptional regulator
MGRWEPGAPERLQAAAMELYGERGYEQTTVAEIAARAGVTERTFFRHFSDKREVFFHGTRDFEELWVDTVADAPAQTTPIQAALAALEAAAALLESRRAHAPARQRILDENPELNERELAKLARVRAGVTQALRDRGADELAAAIIAGGVLAAFHAAFKHWVYGEDPRPLPVIARGAVTEMVALLGCGQPARAPSAAPAR